MSVRQSYFTVILATLVLSLSPSVASAIRLSFICSETQLTRLLPSPAFVAEGQIGNIALNGGAEFDVDQDEPTDTNSQVDFVWSNGEHQPFSLTYDGSTVSYTVGEETLESNITGSFKDLFIYTRAAEEGSSTLLDNLLLKDSSMTLSISGISATDTNGGLSIVHIYDIGSSFTLTGNTTLSWSDSPQSPSDIGYQIQVGNVESPQAVPEPSTVLGLLLSTGALALGTRRR